MKSIKKAVFVMMPLSILFGLSCSTSAKYIVPSLRDRPLRVDIETPRTAFRYHVARKCGFMNLKTCWDERIEYDFDFNKKEDRIKMNEMGFECLVVRKP